MIFMRKETLTLKIVKLAIFLSIGIVLNIVESFIPLPILLPGVKLGIANTIGLIILYYYSIKEYLLLGFFRVIIVGLLRTGIGSVAFMLSLSGWFLSSVFTILVYKLTTSSIYGLSITSSIFHQFGQIIMVMVIYKMVAMINYLPFLLCCGFISGILVAIISKTVIFQLNKIFKLSIES